VTITTSWAGGGLIGFPSGLVHLNYPDFQPATFSRSVLRVLAASVHESF
jgi:hypothetical protein